MDAAANGHARTDPYRRTDTDRDAQANSKKTATPVKTTTPVPMPSSGGNSVQIITYTILAVIICAEFAVIIYLIKKKK